MRENVRRLLALFLAFAAVCTVFAGDIRISRAEERAGEISGSCEAGITEDESGPEDAGGAGHASGDKAAEAQGQETDASEETEARGESPGGSAEEPEEEAAAESEGKPEEEAAAAPEGKPEREAAAVPEGEPGEETAAAPKGEPEGEAAAVSEGKPGEETAAVPEGEPEEEAAAVPEGKPGEETVAVPEGKPEEEAAAVLKEGPEEKSAAELAEEPGGFLTEHFAGGPRKVSPVILPDGSEETAEERTEEESAEGGNGSGQARSSGSEGNFPVCVACREISFLEKADGRITLTGKRVHEDVETDAGETVSTQHRTVIGVVCIGCDRVNYELFPNSCAEISVEYSDPSMIGSMNYLSGRWNEDDHMRDTGCLQVDSQVQKPGITDVKLSYCMKHEDYYNYYYYYYGSKCFYCPVRMPYSRNNSWHRYEESYRITAYAEYTLRYDANAGGEKVEHMPSRERDRACTDSVKMKISDEKPERTGYDFIGWSEEKTALLSEYRPGDSITLNWTEGKTAEKTLYAVWQKVVPGIGSSRKEPDLTFRKKACGTDAQTPVVSVETGEEYSYVVTVRNNAAQEIRDLNVSETFDENLIQLLTIPQDYKNGIWTIDRLGPGETAVLILPVKALAKCPEYENTIHVLAKDEDGNYTEVPPGEDDIPSAVVEIRAPSDLIIQKEADRQTVEAGETAVYTITVRNPGNTAAENVKITDQLPECLEWTGAFLQRNGEDAKGLAVEREPEDHVYEAGDLKAGESVTLTIQVRAAETDEEVIINTASARREDGPEVRDSARMDVRRTKEPDKEREPEGDPPPEEEHPDDLPPVPETPESPGQPTVLLSRETIVPDSPREDSGRTEGGSIHKEIKEEPREIKIRADKPVRMPDPRMPLGHRGRHLCCILHFVILLLALLAEMLYTKNMKKHQKRIFDLREELADAQSGTGLEL